MTNKKRNLEEGCADHKDLWSTFSKWRKYLSP